MRRLIGLVLLLALGLLASDTDRALARFKPHANGGVSAPAAKRAMAAHPNDFHFKPRAVDLSRAFQPYGAWELMEASGWLSFEPLSLATTITVNTTANTVAADTFCSLPEAIMAANTDTAVNECPMGSGLDTIVFALGAGTPTINIGGIGLPFIDQGVIIQGNTGGATRIVIDGGGIDFTALQINGDGTSLYNLVINNLNAGTAIEIAANGVLVQNCFIGTDATGTAAANNSGGILITGANNVLNANVIAGNSGNGVGINGGDNNQLLNNLIGRNAANTADIPNGGDGVRVSGNADNNIIGLAASGNVIAASGGYGVFVASDMATGNKVSGNSIFGNTDLGIKLEDVISPLPNDPGDGDTGSNDRQNYPVINSITGGVINASLNSTANTVFRIEFFANTTCDPSGNGEGEVYLGSTTVTTDSSGNVSFTFNITTPVANKPSITATATNPAGSTSEFSVCQTAPACTYGISPTGASFTASGGSNSVSVTVGAGCPWTAVSNALWITINSGTPGSGNGSVGYSVAANGSASPRSGTMTIALLTFTVYQTADAVIVVGDFSTGIPPSWQVVDNGSPAFYNNDTSQPLTWTTSNPCGQIIGPPFDGPFAIVDASCTDPSVMLDEELRLPPFNATGLGSVFVEFYSRFKWDAAAPNIGDVDVSTNGGTTWTNFLRLQNINDGYTTPVLKSINITSAIAPNPANVLVRLHYYSTSPPPSLLAAPTLGGQAHWAVDFGAYSYTISPTSASFSISGGNGTINVATSTAIPSPQGVWTAMSNAPWITINSGAGPTQGPGMVNYTVAPNPGASRDGSITVSGRTFMVMQAGCSAITVNPATLPAGTAGTAYNQTVTASPGGGYTFAVTAGSLPPGLSLSTGGALTGTPTARGTYNFTVTATGASSCTGSRAYSLTINCPTVALAPTTLPNAQINTSYSQSITATPAGGNYTFAVTSGTLPTGLTLSAAGLLSGTPTQNGTFNFRITATGFGSCSNFRDYQIVVSGCPTITIVPPSLSDGVVGKNYSQNVNATPGGTYTFAVTSGALPNGLKLDAATGKLTGTPKKAGTFNFTVTATGAGACTGSRAYTVRISAANSKASDYDGDGKSDFALWRGMTSEWLILKSSDNQVQTDLWGAAYEPYRDVIAPGDYDGDGQSDVAVFRRGGAQAGHWYIKRSSDGVVVDKYWGLGTDLPVPGDYDGDGQTDIAVWRGKEGNWYIVRSSDGQTQIEWWGAASAAYRDVPVPADYDGDGRADVAVFRQTTGHWYIRQSSDGQVVDKYWGLGTDVPVAADYDGDGKADVAVWRGSEGRWYILLSGRSSDQATQIVALGDLSLGDVPAPGDYDGDGKADAAVWRASTGMWFVLRSRDGRVMTQAQGQAGDTPAAGRRR